MAVDALEEARAALARVRAAHQRDSGCASTMRPPSISDSGSAAAASAISLPNGAPPDCAGTLAGKRRIVARRPDRPPGDIERDRRAGARRLRLRRAAEAEKEVNMDVPQG